MKLAVFSVLSAVAFLSDGSIISEAFPLDNTEDQNLFQDSTGEGLTDNIVAPGPGPGPGVSKIIMVADADLLSTLKALGRNMPERILSPEHRDGSPDQSSISIIRRDTKRCMVGRVYRPCWDA